MWGITLHYYTIPTGNWRGKGSATSFDEQQYFNTMKNTLRMEELVTKHSAIMDKYDTQKALHWLWTNGEYGRMLNPVLILVFYSSKIVCAMH